MSPWPAGAWTGSAARSFYLRSGAIFAGLVAALVLIYPAVVRSEIGDASFVRVMILVLSVNGLVDYFFLGKFRVLLMADQRGYVISAAQIAGTVVMTVVCILMIRAECSALLVKGAAALVYLLRSAAVAVYVRRKYPHVSFRAEADLSAFSQRWAALLHQIVGMICNNTDIILMTLLLGQNKLVEVSVYGTYNLVGYGLSSLLTSVSNGIAPSFGQVISLGETDVLRRSYQSYEYLFFMMVFVAYTCMAVLLYPFVRLYSLDFADSAVYVRWALVALFTLAGLLQTLRLPGLTVIVAAGHYRQTRGRAVLEAAINLVVSVALIFRWGIYGVLLGTCASYLYRTADVIVYTAKNFLPGTLGRTAARLARNLLCAALLTAGGIRFVPLDGGWGTWVLSAVCVGAASCVVLGGVNILREPAEFRSLLARTKEVLARRVGGA